MLSYDFLEHFYNSVKNFQGTIFRQAVFLIYQSGFHQNLLRSILIHVSDPDNPNAVILLLTFAFYYIHFIYMFSNSIHSIHRCEVDYTNYDNKLGRWNTSAYIDWC